MAQKNRNDPNAVVQGGCELFFKRSVAPLLVLRLLRERECHIPEIPEKIAEMTGGAVQIYLPYTICKRLMGENLIARTQQHKDGRKRKTYSITEKGIEFLNRESAAYLKCVDSVAVFLRSE
jgi:DNA-binding PadR family transcriptional regulator